nr:hypothetical protein [Halorussus pelagicus]
MNLTGLVGILAGPLLGALIALVVNVFSAALGHGASACSVRTRSSTLAKPSSRTTAFRTTRRLTRPARTRFSPRKIRARPVRRCSLN